MDDDSAGTWQLTDDQRELRARIQRFAAEEVRPRVLEIDDGGDYPHEIHEAMGREGLFGLGIPEEYGGSGASGVAFANYIEELARYSCAVSLIATYVKLAALPILLGGSEELKQRYVPGLASGEQMGAYALTEPAVGSDPASLQTRAEKRGDVWVLNGEKKFIGNAGLAGMYVVFARTGDQGAGGISAFVVEAESPGFTVEPLETMGMPGWKLGAPRFEDVEVPEDNLIGREGDGFKLAMRTFDNSRPTVAAQAVGVAQGAIDLALDYAMRRHAFGQELINHEGIQFKLAELEAEVLAARALTYQAATLVDEGHPGMTKLAAAAKLFASDTAMRATTEAVQVLGGNGYLKEFPAERMMRDAKVLQIYEGANEIQRLVVARQMVQQAQDREPIWPESMPGSEGVETGESPPVEEAGARA